MYKTKDTPADLKGVTIPKPGTMQEAEKPIQGSDDKFYLLKDKKYYEVILPE